MPQTDAKPTRKRKAPSPPASPSSYTNLHITTSDRQAIYNVISYIDSKWLKQDASLNRRRCLDLGCRDAGADRSRNIMESSSLIHSEHMCKCIVPCWQISRPIYDRTSVHGSSCSFDLELHKYSVRSTIAICLLTSIRWDLGARDGDAAGSRLAAR